MPVIVILLIVTDDPLLFVTVVFCVELVDPTLTLPKEREVGFVVTVPVPPGAYPDSATPCGELLAESLKASVAVRVPLVVGANATFAVQLAPAARLVPQVFEMIR